MDDRNVAIPMVRTCPICAGEITFLRTYEGDHYESHVCPSEPNLTTAPQIRYVDIYDFKLPQPSQQE